ncbi:hypothetical protein DSO57_1032829 [Entomophthora muscae]|uniref:Uncharacterized protein n=1 Tax=Entomophthora muscae TaxID=34485 RepID=A0ACC2U9S3_9FUNG|nr:hypothetical protein DSO57_1032829 [Entomophthora muscae]
MGLIDLMVPASGPWYLLGKLLSYIVKLAPILWWALPAGLANRLLASSKEPPQTGSLIHTPYTRAIPLATEKDQATLDLEEKPEHTAQGIEVLSKDPYIAKHLDFKPFLEYFEPQWIGKVVTQRQGKACAKASWNIYQAAINGELKTTSALEVYHKHLKANFGLHPKVNKFFSILHHEQEKTISKLRDLSNCVPPPSQPPAVPSSPRPSRQQLELIVTALLEGAKMKKVKRGRSKFVSLLLWLSGVTSVYHSCKA